MRIDNTILLKIHNAGGNVPRRDIMRSLQRFKRKDREDAFNRLEEKGLITIDEVIKLNPGPYAKKLTMTDLGKKELDALIESGLVVL